MTDSTILNNTVSLFTLRGQIVVQFIDGDTLEGEFATQDAYNVFIKINNEPVMIPRQQIRYIKGLSGQSIMPDTSPQESEPSVDGPPVDNEGTQPLQTAPPQIVMTQPLPVAPDETSSPSTPPPLPPSDEEEEEEEDGTLILMPDTDISGTAVDIDDDVDEKEEIEEEEDDDDDDDDGTMVIKPDTDLFGSSADVDLVSATNDSLPTFPEDEAALDMTVVLGDTGLPEDMDIDMDEDEPTIALGMDEDKSLTAQLTCTNGPHIGEVYQLHAGITTVGRSSDNAIVLSSDKEISRHHAIILFESDKYVMQDQNSLNGTFVNEEQISGPRYLEDGDVILVGVSYLKYEVT